GRHTSFSRDCSSAVCSSDLFAQPPARLEKPYLEPDDVLAIARAGAQAGCHEALFTLGERPELRYPAAAEWLAARGYDSTVHYLADRKSTRLNSSHVKISYAV